MNTNTRRYYSTADVLKALGYDESAPAKKVRSAESRLSNLRRGEVQKRKINSASREGYREQPTILPPRLERGIDWIEITARRVAYTMRGKAKAMRWIQPYKPND
jgi:hypothetical protein